MPNIERGLRDDLIRLLLQNEDWCCYVAAPTRGKAKHPFNGWDGHGRYTDVRAQKVKDCPDTPEGVYDADCPELEKLGVRYLTEEEMEENA